MINTPTEQIISSAGLKDSPALGSVCTALSDILTSGVDVHRCQAAKALGRIGANSSVKPLIKALLDEDEDVRSDAAEALSQIGDPQAGEQLLENLLGDPCTEVKISAIDMLAKTGDPRVIPWLRRLVKGRDEEIAWDEEEFYLSGWDDWVGVQVSAVNALAQLGAVEAVDDIVEAIHDENAQDFSEPALKALAKLGEAGIEALGKFLDHTDKRLRRRAAAMLATIEGDEARQLLKQALGDPHQQVRIAVLEVRGGLFPQDPILAETLDDSDADIRTLAVQLIGKYYSDEIIAMLDDGSGAVQSAALLAYAKLDNRADDDGLVETFVQKLQDPRDDVATAASNTLAVVAPQIALGELATIIGDVELPLVRRLGALNGLAAIGGEVAISALTSVIDDDQRQVRLETMTALADLAVSQTQWPNDAADALLGALSGHYEPEDLEAEKDPENEETADTGEDDQIQASEKIDEEVSQSENVDGSDIDGSGIDGSEDDGSEIDGSDIDVPDIDAPDIDAPDIDATSKIHSSPEADTAENIPTSTLESMISEAPAISKAVGLPEQGIELSAADMERLALAKRVIGKKKMSVAPQVATHVDIRRFAARVLGDLDHLDVIDALAASLQLGDKDIRLAAADSLARIGQRVGGFNDDITVNLLDNLTAEDRDLKLLIIRALAACDGEQVYEQLHTLLSDDDSFVRAEATRSLAGWEIGVGEFENLLGDPDPSVRFCAAEAISRVGGSDATKQLAEFSFSFEGYHGRQTARLLRDLDQCQASAYFLDVLEDPEQKRVWSVAIEALEELNR